MGKEKQNQKLFVLQCLTSLTIQDNWLPKDIYAKQIYAISDFRRSVNEICCIWESTLPKIPKETDMKYMYSYLIGIYLLARTLCFQVISF
jgi:hypothetical protein